MTPTRRNGCLAILLVGACGIDSRAQSTAAATPLREPGFGRVTALDGSPWAGAVVHLLHRPHSEVLDESVADRITTTTDARGRFRADLLPVSQYLVWAHEPLDADPDREATRVTAFVTDGRARTPIFLTETAPVIRRRFRLATDDGSWDDTKPRVFAWSGGPERPVWRVADTRWLEAIDGVFELPPWPDEAVPIAVYGRGWQLWSSDLATRGSDDEAGQVTTLQLPPLQRRQVVVGEAKGGTPLADVEILDARRVPGTLPVRSDARGGFEIARASASEDFPLLLTHAHLRSPEHFERALSDRTLSKQAAAGNSRIELERAAPLKGRLLLGGVPVADSLVLLEARDGLPGKAFVVGAPRTVRTDAEGRFRLPIPDRSFPLRVTWIPSPAERALLVEAWRANHADESDPPPTSPLVVLREAVEPLTADETLEFDLLDLRHLDLTLRGSDDLPATTGARLLLFPPLTNPQAWRFPLELTTDRRGRVRMLRHGSFDDLQLIAVAGSQALATSLVPLANRDDQLLRFDPRQVVTVRVLDAEGRPWSDAVLLAANSEGAGAGLQAACGTALWFHAARLRSLLQHGSRTAEDGTLHLLVTAPPEALELQLRSADGAVRVKQILKLPAEAAGPIRLEARFEPARD